jgi:osmotically-inducible protein OsmY
MICHNCVSELAGSPKFCPKCGAKIELAVTTGSEKGIGTPATSVSSSAHANPAHSTNSAAAEDRVICPTCSTPNLTTARFCKKDGTPLQGGIAGPVSAAPGTAPKSESKPAAQRAQPAYIPGRQPIAISGKTFIFVGIAVVAAATFAVGALYWGGYIGDRQGAVGQRINAELRGKGLSNVKIVVPKDWKAVVEGMVASQVEKDQALSLIKQYGELKEGVIDNIRVKPSRAEMEVQLNKVLADAGMRQVTAQIDEAFTTVTLNDPDLVPESRTKAEQLVTSTATAAAGVAPVRVTHAAAITQPPPLPADVTPSVDEAAVARSLNEDLRNAGLGDVSAVVDASGNANLQGTVASPDEKNQAIQLALSHQGVAGVGDSIKVAPQTASPAPPPRLAPPQSPPVRPAPAPPPVAKLDPAKLEGDINRALRNGGVGGVTAQVADDFSVTLKGSTTSAGQKDRAFQIARQFLVKGAPKDRVFVVEQ